MYRIVGYRKDVVRMNLKMAFPEWTDNELKINESKFYHHFCDLIFEAIKALSISPEQLLRRIKIINPELVEQYHDQHRSFILYSGHLGNWEWMSSFPLVLKPKVVTFYLPLSNQYFNQLINTIRGRFGVESVEANRGYKALLNYSAAKTETFTLFLADQSPHKDTGMHWTPFFNLDTAFNIGINAIAQKMKMVVLFPHYRKVRRGYYEVTFVQIWDGVQALEKNQLIDTFAGKLESAIRESPDLWLWTHRRWKLKREKAS